LPRPIRRRIQQPAQPQPAQRKAAARPAITEELSIYLHYILEDIMTLLGLKRFIRKSFDKNQYDDFMEQHFGKK
jgi:hypothetical protein